MHVSIDNYAQWDRTLNVIVAPSFPIIELEGLLIQHPLVNDVAVVSRYSNEKMTELPLAFIVLKAGTTPS